MYPGDFFHPQVLSLDPPRNLETVSCLLLLIPPFLEGLWRAAHTSCQVASLRYQPVLGFLVECFYAIASDPHPFQNRQTFCLFQPTSLRKMISIGVLKGCALNCWCGRRDSDPGRWLSSEESRLLAHGRPLDALLCPRPDYPSFLSSLDYGWSDSNAASRPIRPVSSRATAVAKLPCPSLKVWHAQSY